MNVKPDRCYLRRGGSGKTGNKGPVRTTKRKSSGGKRGGEGGGGGGGWEIV